MSDYSAKLKDPRWQKKRLEVFNAHDFTCQMCGAKDETLHVHHVNYRKGAKPWEYELHELRCFCERCHKEVEGNIESARVTCANINHNHLNEILRQVQRAYFEAASIEAKYIVSETLSIALRRVQSRAIINGVKSRIAKGEKFDGSEFEDAITHFLGGGEVEQ
jgi:hypothetical protein